MAQDYVDGNAASHCLSVSDMNVPYLLLTEDDILISYLVAQILRIGAGSNLLVILRIMAKYGTC